MVLAEHALEASTAPRKTDGGSGSGLCLFRGFSIDFNRAPISRLIDSFVRLFWLISRNLVHTRSPSRSKLIHPEMNRHCSPNQRQAFSSNQKENTVFPRQKKRSIFFTEYETQSCAMLLDHRPI